MTTFTLSTATLNSSIELHLIQSLKFFNHDTLLLPILLSSVIFPCIISISSSYRCPLMTCLRYCNFLIFIVFINVFLLQLSKTRSISVLLLSVLI
ncbi:unnamed protein product [Diabrotica balteata]|uniref:Uncharacterized protein n=1 Tax=Diabrotica balteata TaxID=107213 RepID=A0A9N9SUZ0_DIABA|nr:unnamed protein product [Diabrotica balteata]